MATRARRVSTQSCSPQEGGPTKELQKTFKEIPPRGAQEGDNHPKWMDILVMTQANEQKTMNAVCRCSKA